MRKEGRTDASVVHESWERHAGNGILALGLELLVSSVMRPSFYFSAAMFPVPLP